MLRTRPDLLICSSDLEIGYGVNLLRRVKAELPTCELRIELVRGHVNTRLAALAAGRYDAIILAMAGLRRLALDVPHTPLDPAIMPPAAAQGALAIQVRDGDDDRAHAVAAAITGLTCARATAEVTAERAMLAHLDGSCHTPIAASATLDENGRLHLDCLLYTSPSPRD